jgi:membrane dipeptidase
MRFRKSLYNYPMNAYPIFDGHNDTLTECFSPEKGEQRSFLEHSETGHLDLPRARAGGLKGGMFAIFTPPPPNSPDRDMLSGVTVTEQGYEVRPRQPVEYAYARGFTNAMIAYAHHLEEEAGSQLALVRSYADLPRLLAEDKLAMILHIEGAEAVGEDLSDLERYYQQGVRSLGLVWSRPNAFGDGVPFRFPGSPDTGPGLTDAGKRLIQACSRRGILVDLAHLNEKGFWDAAKTLEKPLVVSHTAVHAICPSTRNLTDAQIEAVARSGGLVGIMFEPMNILPSGKPDDKATLADLVRHIDYVARRVGVDYVGLGSDMDGAQMPLDFKDATALPNLVGLLKEKGYQGKDLEKILYKNWFRVIQAAWS